MRHLSNLTVDTFLRNNSTGLSDFGKLTCLVFSLYGTAIKLTTRKNTVDLYRIDFLCSFTAESLTLEPKLVAILILMNYTRLLTADIFKSLLQQLLTLHALTL